MGVTTMYAGSEPQRVRDARAFLQAARLRFGDQEQIKACRTIRQYADQMEAAKTEAERQEAAGKKRCPECDGEGVHECSCGDEHDCEHCGGEGWV